jgi:hypothetical protein
MSGWNEEYLPHVGRDRGFGIQIKGPQGRTVPIRLHLALLLDRGYSPTPL